MIPSPRRLVLALAAVLALLATGCSGPVIPRSRLACARDDAGRPCSVWREGTLYQGVCEARCETGFDTADLEQRRRVYRASEDRARIELLGGAPIAGLLAGVVVLALARMRSRRRAERLAAIDSRPRPAAPSRLRGALFVIGVASITTGGAVVQAYARELLPLPRPLTIRFETAREASAAGVQDPVIVRRAGRDELVAEISLRDGIDATYPIVGFDLETLRPTWLEGLDDEERATIHFAANDDALVFLDARGDVLVRPLDGSAEKHAHVERQIYRLGGAPDGIVRFLDANIRSFSIDTKTAAILPSDKQPERVTPLCTSAKAYDFHGMIDGVEWLVGCELADAWVGVGVGAEGWLVAGMAPHGKEIRWRADAKPDLWNGTKPWPKLVHAAGGVVLVGEHCSEGLCWVAHDAAKGGVRWRKPYASTPQNLQPLASPTRLVLWAERGAERSKETILEVRDLATGAVLGTLPR